MYTSVIDLNRRTMERVSFVYLLVSLFCALFGGVYESFSHQVYSGWMIYAFLVPLAGGTLPFLSLALAQRRMPGRISRNLYNAGIATLTVGCLFQGVLDIYGTSNRLMSVYWIAGACLTATGILCYLFTGNRWVEPFAGDGGGEKYGNESDRSTRL